MGTASGAACGTKRWTHWKTEPTMPTTTPQSAQESPKRRGRPTGSTIPAELRKSVMLRVLVTPAQAEKFDLLGGPHWMREKIDRARI
jgi:hypothetical protein